MGISSGTGALSCSSGSQTRKTSPTRNLYDGFTVRPLPCVAVADMDSGVGGGCVSSGIEGSRLPGLAAAPRPPEPGDGKSGRLNLSVPIGGSVTLVGEYAYRSL